MFRIKVTKKYFLENFPWESKEQKEGFLSLMQWLRGIPAALTGLPLFLVFCYLVQKDHESSEWMIGVIGDRVRRLEDEIALLREELRTGHKPVE